MSAQECEAFMFSFGKSSYETKLLNLLQFKFFITARRNKILAKWAGGRLGYKESALNKYIRSIILFYLTVPSDQKVIDRILSDFKKAGIKMTEEIIKQKIKVIEERIKAKRGTKYID
ncbi:MAG: DUF1476 domain-containing protein [Holosporaceae bacterium]|jgi:hypothetical protein|nr:DUF1476 domain-containing protein [Holosporaceae bacterium]